MRRFIALLALLALSGCRYGEIHNLDEQYRPLEVISERPDLILPDTAISTVGTTVYVVDLDDFLVKNPEGSLTYHAVLLHEQIHATRQLHDGVMGWLANYLTDADFMWAEEQRGWYKQLTTLRAGGALINVDGVAAILAGYKTLTGKRMVSVADARGWILEVMAGRWTPPVD